MSSLSRSTQVLPVYATRGSMLGRREVNEIIRDTSLPLEKERKRWIENNRKIGGPRRGVEGQGKEILNTFTE